MEFLMSQFDSGAIRAPVFRSLAFADPTCR